MPLPFITPSSTSVHRGQSKQFAGLLFPPVAFWTVYGPGSIDQSGLYTPPVSAGGPTTAVISYHTEVWSYFPSAYFAKNADDSLTKTTDNPAYYGQCVSSATLNGAMDQVEHIAHTNNPYWVGVRSATGSHEFVYSLNGNQIRETHPSGLVVSSSFGIGIGQTMKFRVEPGGKLTIWVDEVLKYTSVYVYYTQPLYFMCDAVAPAWTNFKPPKFIGPTVGSTYVHAEAAVSILPPILLPYEGCELYCDPHMMTQAEGSGVTTLTDYSGKDRHLTALATAPTFRTNVLGGKSVVRFDGAQQHLRNPAAFPVRCGWIVVKYNGGTFAADHKGLLTDYYWQGILVSSILDQRWYDFVAPGFEFRSDDRIYPSNAAPGPMGQFRIIFFRYWNGPMLCDGIQLGRDRTFTTRLWNGDVALVALYSRDFTEEEIRANTQKIAANYGMTSLADVYPYQADVSDTAETPLQTVNVYDPPEGGARIVEVLDAPKRLLNLKFSVAGEAEARAMKKFHRDHYPEVACIYRDYRFTPPEDIEGYINSPYQLEGSTGDFQYSFTFREK
jgi:hypothetical protein